MHIAYYPPQWNDVFLSHVILGFSCDNNLSSTLQYTIKSKETIEVKINFEFKKGVGTVIKVKKQVAS